MYHHIHAVNSSQVFKIPPLHSKDISTAEFTDRQASAKTLGKIPSLVQIYGARSMSSNKTKRSLATSRRPNESKAALSSMTGRRSSARLAVTSSVATSTRGQASQKTVEAIQAKPGQTNKRRSCESLEQTVRLTKSDLFELRRDIATYEHELSLKTGLDLSLSRLNSLASTLPDIFQSFTQISAHEQAFFDRLQEDVRQLGLLESAVEFSAGVPHEDLQIRVPKKAEATLEYFRGAAKVSGVYCIISIQGDDLAERFNVRLQTMTGEEFGMSVRHKLVSSALTPAFIRKTLLPCFYLTMTGEGLKLCFDARCPTEFLTLLTEIKGSPSAVSTLILTEDKLDNSVFLTLLEPPAELKLARSKLPPGKSLSDVNVTKLMRTIAGQLVYNKGTGELIWASRGKVQTQTFIYKHEVSKLLDEAYVREVMEASFSFLFATELVLNGQTCRVEVLGYRQVVKLKVACGGKVIEANHDELRMLKELQGLRLTSFVTLSKSLELEKIVEKLFTKRNVIT
jgi:hypothetical protein